MRSHFTTRDPMVYSIDLLGTVCIWPASFCSPEGANSLTQTGGNPNRSCCMRFRCAFDAKEYVYRSQDLARFNGTLRAPSLLAKEGPRAPELQQPAKFSISKLQANLVTTDVTSTCPESCGAKSLPQRPRMRLGLIQYPCRPSTSLTAQRIAARGNCVTSSPG